MPGAYAHLTVVNTLCSRKIFQHLGFPDPSPALLVGSSEFLDLGAVSPDYPYLDLGNENAKRWADAIHEHGMEARLQTGLDALREAAPRANQSFGMCLAWFLGFVSHVIMDVSLHPVIQKIAPYDKDPDGHRLCEMHQDAFIFHRLLNVGEIYRAEFIDVGLQSCDGPEDDGLLPDEVVGLWSRMLESADEQEFTQNKPDIQHWHGRFVNLVDKVAEEASRIPFLGRHLTNAGLTYPRRDRLDRRYLRELETPDRRRMEYQDLFEWAQSNVEQAWTLVAQALFENDAKAAGFFVDMNLDTGRRSDGSMVYWREA